MKSQSLERVPVIESGPRSVTYGIVALAEGYVGLAATSRGLSGLTLPHATEAEAFVALGLAVLDDLSRDDDTFAALAARLDSYYAGEPVDFDEIVLDLYTVTQFRRRVLETVRAIPRGQVKSYGQIAAEVGRPAGARAVGGAMGSNPVCVVVPCHRVIASDGGLGGFGGQLDRKERMLVLEGATLR
jgi:methylated-DNA-[protein]-cysteine S-methyltransferase